jgi:glycosyltransferase involved in cell wall biosynthesis
VTQARPASPPTADVHLSKAEPVSNPKVSVIVPAYNTAPYIAETVASVLAQTYTDYEVIVVNDGSPDTPALEAALAPFRDRIHYIVQENRGLSGARNTGIAASRGELIALLDSDDVWEPEYLEQQLSELERQNVAVVYPDAVNFGDPMRAGRRFMAAHPSHGPVTLETLVTQQCNVMVSVVARRDVLVGAGLFDESLRSSEDFDMWLRVLNGGWRIGYHRRPLVRSRLRPESLSANGVSMCQHIVRVLDKTARNSTLTPAQAALVADRRAYFTALLRLHEGKRAFFAGEHKQALQALSEANARLRRIKLTMAILLLRIMPGLLLRAYDARDRLVFRTSTR